MIQHSLTDNQRTLLSAYHDGELSGTEQTLVEDLLASSQDARAYLDDLQAVNRLSLDAFPAVTSTGEFSGATVSTKLSAEAIKTAAEKAALAKGTVTGSWAVTGLVSVTAAVVTGAVLLFSGGPSTDNGSISDPLPLTSPAPANAVPELAGTIVSPPVLDSSNLMVPPMTPDDLVRFAVNGILPIGAERTHYITVDETDNESNPQQLETAESLPTPLFGFDFAGQFTFDSLQSILRTSLLQYSEEDIAVRSDLPELRMQLIDQLQELKQLPAQTKQQLHEIRRRIELQQLPKHTVVRAPHTNEAEEDVEYIVVRNGLRKESSGSISNIQIPEVSAGAGGYRSFTLNNKEFGTIQPRPTAPKRTETTSRVVIAQKTSPYELLRTEGIATITRDGTSNRTEISTVASSQGINPGICYDDTATSAQKHRHNLLFEQTVERTTSSNQPIMISLGDENVDVTVAARQLNNADRFLQLGRLIEFESDEEAEITWLENSFTFQNNISTSPSSSFTPLAPSTFPEKMYGIGDGDLLYLQQVQMQYIQPKLDSLERAMRSRITKVVEPMHRQALALEQQGKIEEAVELRREAEELREEIVDETIEEAAELMEENGINLNSDFNKRFSPFPFWQFRPITPDSNSLPFPPALPEPSDEESGYYYVPYRFETVTKTSIRMTNSPEEEFYNTETSTIFIKVRFQQDSTGLPRPVKVNS